MNIDEEAKEPQTQAQNSSIGSRSALTDITNVAN